MIEDDKMNEYQTSDFESRNITIDADEGNIVSIGQGIENVKINVSGKSNEVIIDDDVKCLNYLNISVKGEFNKIHIHSKCMIRILDIEQNGLGNFVEINEGCVTKKLHICCSETSEVKIGKDCLITGTIRTSDGHTIFDVSTGERLNYCESVYIGDHCWLGDYAYILKGVSLADNTIVAAASMVTKPFTESNIVLAGNPARIVKRNVNFERKLLFK